MTLKTYKKALKDVLLALFRKSEVYAHRDPKILNNKLMMNNKKKILFSHCKEKLLWRIDTPNI